MDATISALGGQIRVSSALWLRAGWTCAAVGRASADSWLGRLVFAFAPHQSHVVLPVTELFRCRNGMAPDTAVLLPLMETAVSFLMDAAPLIGEQVAIFGQGIVGLLTTALLADYPLSQSGRAGQLAAAPLVGAGAGCADAHSTPPRPRPWKS